MSSSWTQSSQSGQPPSSVDGKWDASSPHLCH